MSPLILLAALGVGYLAMRARDKQAPPPALERPGSIIKGKSGTTWEVKLLKFEGPDILNTVFTKSGTRVLTYRTKRGTFDQPKFVVQRQPGVDSSIFAKAVKDFGLTTSRKPQTTLQAELDRMTKDEKALFTRLVTVEKDPTKLLAGAAKFSSLNYPVASQSLSDKMRTMTGG